MKVRPKLYNEILILCAESVLS
uniref:Uncharacterized protein n=1 Tax=Anguilla anguilla TaxID=7936 RepID=A0A0E9VCU9_ANGAN